MPAPDSDNVIVATRFSRLRPPAGTAPPRPPDLYCEALSALAEALDLLALALVRIPSGYQLDAARVRRLDERATALVRHISDTSPRTPEAAADPHTPATPR